MTEPADKPVSSMPTIAAIAVALVLFGAVAWFALRKKADGPT